MSQQVFVAVVKRDHYYYPRLRVSVEARVFSRKAAEAYVAAQMLKLLGKRRRWVRVKDYRIVDAEGLKRLYAAEKASITVRRKRAARKGVITRLRNRGFTVKVTRDLRYTVVKEATDAQAR